uniref:Uncharacterized protein n=1 Tax=Laticauda laticaudata TaxID=8630 RepID=A0A8C5SN13_LATLA
QGSAPRRSQCSGSPLHLRSGLSAGATGGSAAPLYPRSGRLLCFTGEASGNPRSTEQNAETKRSSWFNAL